jgi:aminoglycoside phosphotransferase (APT) family kinase protein
MASDSLTNQIKSLEDAVRQLQQRVSHLGGDAKANELLHCSRSLLTRLALDGELAPQLAAAAREQFEKLQPAIQHVLAAVVDSTQRDILALLQETHARLAAINSPEAAALCRQLVNIEAAYIDAFEKAFRAAMAVTPSAPAGDASANYDCQALAKFLAPVFSTPELKVKSIEMISGGFSKLTLRANLDGGADVPSVLALRSDLPAGKGFVGTMVADEYPILQVAHRHGVRVPQPYAIDTSGRVIGTPFMALGYATGRSVGTLFEFPPRNAELGGEVARQLALIHAIPMSELGVKVMGPEVATVDRIRGEIDKSYAGWQSVGRYSAIIEEGFRRLRQHIHLADGQRTLVHGDIGLHNMMVENNRVTAMLDWEFTKLGNPADDLGYFYYTADHLMGWDAFVAEYVRAGGIAPPREQVDFYCLLGLIRVCGYCYLADAAFTSGRLAQIQYAPPYNVYLRGSLLRAAKLLETFAQPV